MEVLPESEFPALYRSADRTAIDNQRRLLVATGVRLSSLITAALCGSFSLLVEGVDLPAIVAAGAMGVALVTEVYLLTTRLDRRWYEARSAAESAKTLAWRYLVGGEPFGLNGAGGQDGRRAETDGEGWNDHMPDQRLLRRFSKITSDLRSVAPISVIDGSGQVTEGMRAIRALSLDERRNHYMVGRLDDQRKWYIRKANLYERRASTWLVVIAGVEAFGLVTATVRAALASKGFDIDLPGVMGAVAAAAVAWLQTRQYQQIAGAYALAALELGDIVVRATWPRTESDWARFVDEAEEAISRERMLWAASHS
ncbi:DUF4231 domain-containing protein [Streptosporangium saharense]|uniref:DUF4231 domain-containing protein n=1 Tax=Streptosporangium saharense TaxID=1706840 RepID=UPI0033170B55